MERKRENIYLYTSNKKYIFFFSFLSSFFFLSFFFFFFFFFFFSREKLKAGKETKFHSISPLRIAIGNRSRHTREGFSALERKGDILPAAAAEACAGRSGRRARIHTRGGAPGKR